MSRSQFAVYQLKKKPELRNLLFRTYEELAQDQIPVQVKNYEQVYLGTMKPRETPEQIKKELEKKQPHTRTEPLKLLKAICCGLKNNGCVLENG